jgi:hypothetical protein
MKNFFKIIVIIITIALIAFCTFRFIKNNPTKEDSNSYNDLENYISIIYGKTFLIPEFDNINDADEDWLWENVNQYLWYYNDKYEEKNSVAYGYTYDEISEIVNELYGDNLTKEFPTGAKAMRYNIFNNMYGPTAYGLENYYDYKIDSIKQEENVYTVSLYDYTVSLYRTLGDNPEDLIDIYNNYDYLLNGDDGTPIISVTSLDDDNFTNLLDYKNQLSHKILKIEYNEQTGNYNIISCKYDNVAPEETLAIYYKKMQDTFEIMNIDYDYEEIYNSDEVLVNNFDELSSIYSQNALDTYKTEMSLFVFKNGKTYITAGDINVSNYIAKIDFENVVYSSDSITCDVIRTFRKSFDSSDEEYNETYTKSDTFTIIKDSDGWIIDEFSYN